MSKEIKLSQEEAEQLFGEIENQGFGYWVEHYGYDGEEDPELVELCKQARVAMSKLREHIDAMSKLREHIDAIWEHYEIG